MIKKILHKDIDKALWDNCIEHSPNETIYPYSWYLDVVSPGWDGLVLNNYAAVFPLTQKRKLGINYLIQPSNCQQLGLFSLDKPVQELETRFLQIISEDYKYVNIQLNTQHSEKFSGFSFSERHNFELSLNQEHEKIFGNYSTNHKRNIKKAQELGVKLEENFDLSKIIDLYRENQGKFLSHSKSEYQNLENVINACKKRGLAEIIGGTTQTGEFCAGAVFIRSRKKSVFLFSATNQIAKKHSVMHYLIDAYINKYSEKDIILDFEGSNEDSLARFYSGFGADCNKYFRVAKNSLPGLMKIIRK